MNSAQFKSTARELITAIGAAVAAFNLANDNYITAISGFLLALAMVVWALYTHADKSVVGTLIRKLVSVLAGAVVSLGILTPEKAEAFLGVVLVIISIYFGNVASKDDDGDGGVGPADVAGAVVFFAVCLFLTSCGTQFKSIFGTADGCILVSAGDDGNVYAAGPCYSLYPDEDGSRHIDRYMVTWENEDGDSIRATRYLDSPREVLIEYKHDDLWLQWDAKSGVSIGPVPGPVVAPPESLIQ